MLFDNKMQKHDITYTYEDPRMYDYLKDILDINNKYKNKFIELKENMHIISNETVKKDDNLQFYVNCVYKYTNDIQEEFSNLSEDINKIYDKFETNYSKLTKKEKMVLANIDTIMEETLFFNGIIYDLGLNGINLTEDSLQLESKIYNRDMLLTYLNISNSDEYYDKTRANLVNTTNNYIKSESFINILENQFLLNEGNCYNARLTTDEKEMLLESILDTDTIKFNANQVINMINIHYSDVITYFNEMTNLTSTNINDYIAHQLLITGKLNECMNIMESYNEILGVYLNTFNKRSNDYTNFFLQNL